MARLTPEESEKLASEILKPYLEMARKKRDFEGFFYLLGPRKKPIGFLEAKPKQKKNKTQD